MTRAHAFLWYSRANVLDRAERERAVAGQPHADVTPEELDEQLTNFKVRLHYAIAAHDGSVAADASIAVLQRQLWNQQALVELQSEDIKAAAEASREAVRHGELAVKLAKSTLADRVSVLERALAKGLAKGRGIAEAARSRK